MISFLKKLSYSDVLTIILMCSLMLLTRTHNVIFLLIPVWGSFFVIRKPECVFPLYYMAALSNAYFTLGGGQSAGRYLSLLIILSLLFKVNKSNYGKDAFIPVIALVLLTLISALSSYTGAIEIFIQMSQCFIVLYLLQKYVTVDIRRLMVYIGLASALVILFVFFEAVSNSAFVFEARYRGVDEGINANRIGMMMEQCAAMMMAFFFLTKNKIIKIGALATFLCATFVVIATGSRSSLLAILVSIPVSLLISASTQSKKTILSVIVLIITAYVAVDYFSEQDTRLFDRFSLQSVEETGGTGRADNAKKIMTEILPDHLLLGSGIGGGNMKALGSQYNLQNLAHNIIIDPLSQLGILIYPIFIFILFRLLKPSLKMMKKYKWYIVPITLMSSAIVNGLGETIFYEKFFWNDIALCMLCGNIYIYGFGKEQDVYGTI